MSIRLVGPYIDEIFDADDQAPAVKIVHRVINGKDYYHAEPVNGKDDKKIGWMMGGTFIWTSDSRFPHQYPIALHDRQDTVEDYERMSK